MGMATNRSPSDDYTVVWTAATMVEAQLALAALNEAEIPAISEDFDVNPYDGVWVPQQGWAKIRVSTQDAERAQEIIKQTLESEPLDENADIDGWPADGPLPEEEVR